MLPVRAASILLLLSSSPSFSLLLFELTSALLSSLARLVRLPFNFQCRRGRYTNLRVQ